MIFLSETVEEMMGFYSPGDVAVITANPAFPSESTQAHEMAHRRLCENTSFGQVTQVISMAWAEIRATDPNSSLSNALQECIENSWVCHEGYAVWQQFAHSLVFPENPMWEVVERTLPLRYRSAAAAFAIDPVALLAHTSPDLSREARRALVGALIDVAGTGIAYAAMATPLVAQLKAGTSLTPIALLLALRSDPPDVRLQKLVRIVTPAKIAAWLHRVAAVSESSSTLTQHIEVCNQIAAEACADAGLSFEPARNVVNFGGELMARLGVSRPLQYHEDADETVGEGRGNVSHATSPISVPVFNAPSVEGAAELIVKWREFAAANGFGQEAGDFRVVAEILGTMNGITKVIVHCYVRFIPPPDGERLKIPGSLLEQFRRLKFDTSELISRLHPDSALHFGCIGFDSAAEIYSLPRLSSYSFTWLLPSLSLDSDFDFIRLAEGGQVYVVDPMFEKWRFEPHQQCLEATGCSWSSALFQNIYLHHYEFDAARGISYVRAGPDPIPRWASTRQRVTFSQACLVDTLLAGALGHYYRKRHR